MAAIIFDCDGVLLDTEPVSEEAWTSVLARYGYFPTREDFRGTRGLVSGDTYQYFAIKTRLPKEADVLGAVDDLRQQSYDSGIAVFPDVIATLRCLTAVGIPLAVASSSSRYNLERKLELCALERYFEVVVAGTDVPAGKPAPDLYLAAARGLEVGPSSCLAIEDSTNGAESAAAAGMQVLMVDRGVGTVDDRWPIIPRIDAELLLLWLE